MKQILLLDDSASIQKVVRLTFASVCDCEVKTARTPPEAAEILQTCRPDVVIGYVRFPRANAPEYYRELRSACANILLLAESDEDVSAFEQMGFSRFLRKPFHSERLRTVVQDFWGGPEGTPQPLPQLEANYGVQPISQIPSKPGTPPPPTGNLRNTMGTPAVGMRETMGGSPARPTMPPPPPAPNLRNTAKGSVPSDVFGAPQFDIGNTDWGTFGNLPGNGDGSSQNLQESLRATQGMVPSAVLQTSSFAPPSIAPISMPGCFGAQVSERFEEESDVPEITMDIESLERSFRATMSGRIPALAVQAIPPPPPAMSVPVQSPPPPPAMSVAVQSPPPPPAMSVGACAEVIPEFGAPSPVPIFPEPVFSFEISLPGEVMPSTETEAPAFEQRSESLAAAQSAPQSVPASVSETPAQLSSTRSMAAPIEIDLGISEHDSSLEFENVVVKAPKKNAVATETQNCFVPSPPPSSLDVEALVDDAIFRALDRSVPVRIDQKLDAEWPRLIAAVSEKMHEEFQSQLNVCSETIEKEKGVLRESCESEIAAVKKMLAEETAAARAELGGFFAQEKQNITHEMVAIRDNLVQEMGSWKIAAEKDLMEHREEFSHALSGFRTEVEGRVDAYCRNEVQQAIQSWMAAHLAEVVRQAVKDEIRAILAEM